MRLCAQPESKMWCVVQEDTQVARTHPIKFKCSWVRLCQSVFFRSKRETLQATPQGYFLHRVSAQQVTLLRWCCCFCVCVWGLAGLDVTVFWSQRRLCLLRFLTTLLVVYVLRWAQQHRPAFCSALLLTPTCREAYRFADDTFSGFYLFWCVSRLIRMAVVLL